MRCLEIGSRLRLAREGIGMSGRKTSQAAGLSIETAHSIESTGRMPGIDTVERLASVLRVSPSWLAFGTDPMRRVMNYRWAPGHSALGAARELEAIIRGEGGKIDHSFLYFDPAGAALYEEVSRVPEPRPLAEAAVEILSQFKEPLSVVALGSGMAHIETTLVECLVRPESSPDLDGEPAIDLYLVDSSACLLGEGHRHAAQRLACHSVPVVAIEGDFRKLPTFSEMFAPRGPRRKLFVLLGYTIGNLDNELSFLRESLLCATRGDLMLFDFGTQIDKSKNPGSALKSEPGAKVIQAGGTVTNNKWLAFLAGPVSRVYGEHGLQVGLRHVPESGVIPNSHSVEFWVKTPDGKQFVTCGWRRYDPESMAAAFARFGWRLVKMWPFGQQRPSSLALFQRVSS